MSTDQMIKDFDRAVGARAAAAAKAEADALERKLAATGHLAARLDREFGPLDGAAAATLVECEIHDRKVKLLAYAAEKKRIPDARAFVENGLQVPWDPQIISRMIGDPAEFAAQIADEAIRGLKALRRDRAEKESGIQRRTGNEVPPFAPVEVIRATDPRVTTHEASGDLIEKVQGDMKSGFIG